MTERNEALELINQAKAQARSEGLKRFLINNKQIISRLVLAGFVALILFLIFNYYQNSQQEKFSAILHQSLIDQQLGDVAKYEENLKKIIDAKSAPAGVKSLASLRYAALLLESNKKEEAAKVYHEVNDCGSCNDYIRELGGLLEVRVLMSDDAEIAKDDLSNRIEKIENHSKVLRYYIAEQRAILEMHKNNLEKSYQIFESIAKNPEVSPTLKARAVDAMKMVVAKGFEPKAEIKSAEKNQTKKTK